ncbi:MAG TPA: DUF924 family protein [Aestuariivirgaceae bacterium]|jgi:uncharacterized protein (DUF924 family)
MRPEDVALFWRQAGTSRWFTKDAGFDGAIAVHFGEALSLARNGAFDSWAETAEGALALVILLDQFSRNVHRGSPLMFAGDRKALAVARQSIGKGFHQAMPADRARWFIMPFEHAEDLDAQWRAVGLCQVMGLNDMTPWAMLHLKIIERFGRFPHRNAILGRPSRKDELAFLAEGGFAG